ncbi:MAG: HAD-IC family P-type ATPase [Halieaceae bacterium]|jgi:P-type Ca2+ transporter type 2C|nr:HAD-IC family P-type ATPase [Halieaceae bacterium]
MDNSITGLSQREALELLRKCGPNKLPEPKRPGLFMIFVSQFKSPFIYVLLVAAVVSSGIGQTINSFFILAVLLLNATIGTFQEFAAQKAASGLEKMVPHQASVLREGKTVVIDTIDIVPGDIVLLASGDKVAADLKLVRTKDLEIDESMLTGESLAAGKHSEFLSDDAMPMGDRLDRAYAGTIVMRGRGQGEVVATGVQTEIGKIATDVTSGSGAQPPLIQRIHQFTKRVTWAILVVIAIIFVITLARGDDIFTVFLLGVALAVSAIPEGLPVAITVALALGMKRMAAEGVIIRKLVAVESLGSCTLIASDKTGTLTVNELTIRRVMLADGTSYLVSGEGMNLRGVIAPENSSRVNPDALQMLLDGGALANEAELAVEDDAWVGRGDHVDIAFLVLLSKAGSEPDDIRKRYTELGCIPYESNNAYSASINSYQNHVQLFAKGSVETLLSMCNRAVDVPSDELHKIGHRAEKLAAEGYRVLGVAHRRLDHAPNKASSCMENLEFIGMVAMIDPLRPEVIDAVKQCRTGGIKVAMVTGDHPLTAQVLAKELGISRGGISRASDDAATGAKLKDAHTAGKEHFDDLVSNTRVFARVEPHQKMQIVQSLIDNGEFVAVTGDGVNDAPALKQANVGISMGQRGSDVARENSDIILTDDNFASIVQGIKQGRIVYNNIRKVIFLLISTGAAEITLIILSILMALPLPLLPLQLLWLNLVTNGIQDVALVFEPEEGNELEQPPRSPREPIFNRLMLQRIIVNAVVMGCLAFSVFYMQISNGVEVDSARNVTLLLMVLFENVHVFNSRSETLSIFRQKFFGNPLLICGMLTAQAIHISAMYIPGLSSILVLEPVTLSLWAQLLSIALLLILVDELHKYWHNRSVIKYPD